MRLTQDRHEVGVALPAGHDVHVQVVCNPGAGNVTQVEPDIESLRASRQA